MLRYHPWGLSAAALLLLLPQPSLAAGRPGIARSFPSQTTQHHTAPRAHTVGLGTVLSTSDGGTIFGWDINQSGNDGVLTTATDVGVGKVKVSVETFDQTTGKITKTFAKAVGNTTSYSMDGIFAGDVALVTHFDGHKNPLSPLRDYDVMKPVTANRLTGQLNTPFQLDFGGAAENQTTTTSALYMFDMRKNAFTPDLVVADIATNSISKIIPLDPAHFSAQNGTQIAQDTKTNQAMLAGSNTGAPGGPPPYLQLVDLSSGKTKTFQLLNGGPFGAGFVNGLAVDSNTGIAAATTELNAQVQFINLATQVSIGVQLPGTGPSSQGSSGLAVALDPINKLFLVAQPISSTASSGSSIQVFDEAGNFIESINGFNFAQTFQVTPIRIAVNPAKRMGFVDGPGSPATNLQQFFY